MDEAVNPFRMTLESGGATVDLGGPDTASPRKALQLRTVADMGVAPAELLKRAPRIAELTVDDLEDLAREFSGVPTENRAVAELTLEDLTDLEEAFFTFKAGVGRELKNAGGLKASSVDVSCCCCTPCCCCAATDMSETA